MGRAEAARGHLPSSTRALISSAVMVDGRRDSFKMKHPSIILKEHAGC
jgi:hypothetical protein